VSRGSTFALVVALALVRAAGAQPVLLPPHIVGPIDAEEADAFAAAFVAAASEAGAEPVGLAGGGPCVTPAECIEPGHGIVFWVQLSGDETGRVGLALRMDGQGEVIDRATGECSAGASADLGAELGAAVAAGEAEGLDISIRRIHGAAAFLDGEPIGRTPVRLRRPIDSGLHVVRVDTRDGRSAVTLVDASVGDVARVDLDLSGLPRGKKVGAWPLIPVLLGGAAAAILIATDPAGIIGPDYWITIVAP